MNQRDAQECIKDAVYRIADSNGGDMDGAFTALCQVYVDLAVEYSEPGCEKEAVDQAVMLLERFARDAVIFHVGVK